MGRAAKDLPHWARQETKAESTETGTRGRKHSNETRQEQHQKAPGQTTEQRQGSRPAGLRSRTETGHPHAGQGLKTRTRKQETQSRTAEGPQNQNQEKDASQAARDTRQQARRARGLGQERVPRRDRAPGRDVPRPSTRGGAEVLDLHPGPGCSGPARLMQHLLSFSRRHKASLPGLQPQVPQ